MRIVRSLIVIGVLVGASVAGYVYYQKRRAANATPQYRTEEVTRGTVRSTVTATGSVSAVTTVQVGSQVSGIIASLHADFNSRVQRGQLLATLDPTPFQAQVEQRRADLTRAEVQARAAEIEHRRSERLFTEGLAAAADFDASLANLDVARAQVDQARAVLHQSEANLTYTRILSPIDGVVVAREYDVGQTVAASFQAPTLFTIAQDLTKMQVQADVDQADIGRISIGQGARFTVDAYPDEEFRGEIAQIRLNATTNQNVITYPVILTVANPEQKLRPQMTANVNITVATVDDALRVPNAALRFRPVSTAETSARTGSPTSASGPTPGREGRLQAAGRALAAGAPPSPPELRRQTVHVLDAGELRPIPVRAGITDGRHTVILEGDLAPGQAVVVGASTTRVQSPASAFPGTGPTGGGGRGMGRRPM